VLLFSAKAEEMTGFRRDRIAAAGIRMTCAIRHRVARTIGDRPHEVKWQWRLVTPPTKYYHKA
jgi:hypothetical protein